MDTEYANKVATLNDEFRRSGFGVTITKGVQALENVPGLLASVRSANYNQFTKDNDPYGEHDFGVIVWHGDKVYFKIDYFDQSLTYGEYPLSPKCKRVMTIMLASEY